jgi:tetratricopeptide (TPR) repeat protein
MTGEYGVPMPMRRLIVLAAFLAVEIFASTASGSSRKDLDECMKSQDHDRGIAACTRVIDAPQSTPRQRFVATAYRCTQRSDKYDYAGALPDCEEATRLDPHEAMAWNNLGYVRRSLGDLDGAIAALDTAISIDPKLVLALQNRADALDETGKLDRALADFDTALRLQSNQWHLYNDRATVWRDHGDYDRAFADFSRAIALEPKAAKAYAGRGEVWRLKGDLVRALQDQDRAIEIAPKLSVGYIHRGDTYRYMGSFDRALADYDHAAEIVPDFTPASTGRGLTYEKMGDLARAKAEFEKALSSTWQDKSDISGKSLETARAHLAALESGVAPPTIPAAPAQVTSETSIPTPQAVVPTAIAPHARQGRRVALVIGNSTYRNVPALANPERDASAIAATLRAVGFDTVTLETNDTREKMVDALRNFAGLADGADWAVVYYAGHGIEIGGINYLIPTDAKFATDRDVQFEAIPFDQVMASLEGAKKLKLVLLDACRDNPFAPQMRRTAPPEAVAMSTTAGSSTAGAPVGTRSIGRGLGEVKVSGATLVVFAAKQGQVALDGEGGDSPFAVAVVQRIATPGVEINKMFRLVRDDVMEATAGRQEPYTYGSLPGREDFFFVQR